MIFFLCVCVCVLFSGRGGIESDLRRRLFFQVEGDEKTLISCLSSDIWLFGSGFSLLIAVFPLAKTGRAGAIVNYKEMTFPPFS